MPRSFRISSSRTLQSSMIFWWSTMIASASWSRVVFVSGLSLTRIMRAPVLSRIAMRDCSTFIRASDGT